MISRCRTSRPDLERCAGFTLIEVIATLAILGLALVIVAGYKPPWSSGLGLKGTASELASGLRLARSEAIASNRPVAFDLDVTDHLYRTYPDLPEGELAKVRASVVNSAALAEVAASLNMGDAVLSAAGHETTVPNVARPAGLTEREVDVLRLIARGRPNKEVARELGISAKTVGTHIEHVYAKAGVTTRAGATLFAMEHDLIRI